MDGCAIAGTRGQAKVRREGAPKVRREGAPYGGLMSDYRRPRISGARIFFTVNVHERGSDVLVREIDALRSAVRLTRAERGFGIDAWVVLPDHMHCIWQMPEGDCDYSTRWMVIKSRFSHAVEAGFRRASHIRRREKAVWQRRFWERHIRNEAEWLALVEYCRMNPVKHGLVERAADWPYSYCRL